VKGTFCERVHFVGGFGRGDILRGNVSWGEIL
jgi:hypothetical protein